MFTNNLIANIANALLITLVIQKVWWYISKRFFNSYKITPNLYLHALLFIGIFYLSLTFNLYHGLSLSHILRGIIGNLSISSLIILIAAASYYERDYKGMRLPRHCIAMTRNDDESTTAMAHSNDGDNKRLPHPGLSQGLSMTMKLAHNNEDSAFAIIVSLLGTLLYLSVFGFIANDIYAMGYFPDIKFMLIFILLELYLWHYARFYAIVWLISLISFYFKLELSHNLWDYLFDPFLWIMCLLKLANKH